MDIKRHSWLAVVLSTLVILPLAAQSQSELAFLAGERFVDQVLLTAEESTLSLIVFGPDENESGEFPIISGGGTTPDHAVVYNLSSGTVELAVAGPLACFDLREDWENNSAVRVLINDQNRIPVADFGLAPEAAFTYFPSPDTGILTVDATADVGCFFRGDDDVFSLFGSEPHRQGLSVRFEGIDGQPFPQQAAIDERIEYRIVVENNSAEDIHELGFLEIYPRIFPENAPAALTAGEYFCIEPIGSQARCEDALEPSEPSDRPFIKGQSLSLPAGSSLIFEVERRLRLVNSDLDPVSALGVQIDLFTGAIERGEVSGRERFHAAAETSIQVIGEGSLEVAERVPASGQVEVSDATSGGVTVRVQASASNGSNLSGISIEALLPEVDGLVAVPSSAQTNGDGVAEFQIRSERADSYDVSFVATGLVSGEQPAAVSTSVSFLAGPVFELSVDLPPDFPNPTLAGTVLPQFDVIALDEFGNQSQTGGTVVLSVLPVQDVVTTSTMTDGLATISGAALPDTLPSNSGYSLLATLLSPNRQGESLPFTVIRPPTASIVVTDGAVPWDNASVERAETIRLRVAAEEVEIDSPGELAIILSGQSPDGASLSGADLCEGLLVGIDCAALLGSLGTDPAANRFSDDRVLFDDMVTVRADAQPGTWTLDFELVLYTQTHGGQSNGFISLGTTASTITVSEVSAAEATGQLAMAIDGAEIIDGAELSRFQGRTVSLDLAAVGVSAAPGNLLAVVFDGRTPDYDGSGWEPGEMVGQALLTPDSFAALAALMDSTLPDNRFVEDRVLTTGLPLRIDPEAETGVWTLRFLLARVDDSGMPVSSDSVVDSVTIELEVNETSVNAVLQVSGSDQEPPPDSLFQGQALPLRVDVAEVDIDDPDVDGLAVTVEFQVPGGSGFSSAELACDSLFVESACDPNGTGLVGLLGYANLVNEDASLFDGAVLLSEDALPGQWSLRFVLESVTDASEPPGAGSDVLDEYILQLEVRADRIFSDQFITPQQLIEVE